MNVNESDENINNTPKKYMIKLHEKSEGNSRLKKKVVYEHKIDQIKSRERRGEDNRLSYAYHPIKSSVSQVFVGLSPSGVRAGMRSCYSHSLPLRNFFFKLILQFFFLCVYSFVYTYIFYVQYRKRTLKKMSSSSSITNCFDKKES